MNLVWSVFTFVIMCVAFHVPFLRKDVSTLFQDTYLSHPSDFVDVWVSHRASRAYVTRLSENSSTFVRWTFRPVQVHYEKTFPREKVCPVPIRISGVSISSFAKAVVHNPEAFERMAWCLIAA